MFFDSVLSKLLFIVCVFFLFCLMEMFAFDRKKNGVNAILSVASWVCVCMSLHLFQFFPNTTIVLMAGALGAYLVIDRLLVFFLNRKERETSEGLKYCLLSVLTMLFMLVMRRAGAPTFVLVGIYSFLFTFFIVGAIHLFMKSRSIVDRLHADIAGIVALIVNLYVLQYRGGALVVFADLDSVIMFYIIVLGVVGSLAASINKYSLTTLAYSVLAGGFASLTSVFLMICLTVA